MAHRKNFLVVQLITVMSEVISLSFLLHTVISDFRSWNHKALKKSSLEDSVGISTTIYYNQNIMDTFSNCSVKFGGNGPTRDYHRSPVVLTLDFVLLLFFWWVNSLFVCIQWRAKIIYFFKAKWLNLLFSFMWLMGGSLILASFLLQRKEDKIANHQICMNVLNQTDDLSLCQPILCQASSSKLISFGLAFLSGWLHLLCFLSILGQNKSEVHEEDKSSLILSSDGSLDQGSIKNSCSQLFPEFSSSHMRIFPFNLSSPHVSSHGMSVRSSLSTRFHTEGALSAKPCGKKSVRFDESLSLQKLGGNSGKSRISRHSSYTDHGQEQKIDK